MMAFRGAFALVAALAIALPYGHYPHHRLWVQCPRSCCVLSLALALLSAAAVRPELAGSSHAAELLRATGPNRPSAQHASKVPTKQEPLSERELEVLRLLASDMTGPEIASQLYLSVNTFRTHTRHIFTKLDVTTRRAAVTRARELDLP